jgi:hypothetical protein
MTPQDLTLVAREVLASKSGSHQRRSPSEDLAGGRDRRRSGDLTLFRRALYQLSYPTG